MSAATSRKDWKAEGDACVALLQELIRIPTVNRGTREDGDGNERPAGPGRPHPSLSGWMERA